MSLGSIRKRVTPKVKYQLLIRKEPTPSFLDYLTLRSSAILLPPPFCNFSSHKSLSTSSRPLSLGLPTHLLLSGFLSKIFLVTFVCFTMVTCPSHSSPMHLMPTAGSEVLRNNFCRDYNSSLCGWFQVYNPLAQLLVYKPSSKCSTLPHLI